MTLTGTRTFVGFGFGAIQAGLFLEEAFRGGRFRRLVVAEVVPGIVRRVREAGGSFRVNIARPDGVTASEVGPVDIFDPNDDDARGQLVEAVAAAEEIATAVPSVSHYTSEAPGSLHRILAAGLRRKTASGGPRAIVYAAENNNHAAELLEEAVLEEVPPAERPAVRSVVCFVNTVIGKMSGVVTDSGLIEERELTTVIAGDRRAFLVEEFNRILISGVRFEDSAPFERGIESFEEKVDLFPFEEAKLYGHNATHALAAYLGRRLGLEFLAELRRAPGAIPFLRAAFLEESGAALVRKHRGIDPLFTHDGYRAYAEDLIARMTNPHLLDTVERVGRDPTRKLRWDDRLVGTARLALAQDVRPRRFAAGISLGLEALEPGFLTGDRDPGELLEPIWAPSAPAEADARQILDLVDAARRRLRAWRESGFADLEVFFCREYYHQH